MTLLPERFCARCLQRASYCCFTNDLRGAGEHVKAHGHVHARVNRPGSVFRAPVGGLTFQVVA